MGELFKRLSGRMLPFLLILLFVASCGGGGGGGGDDDNPPADDTTPPTVVNRTPSPNSANVSISSLVTATFSESIDPDTINSETFTLSSQGGAEDGDVTYSSAARRATFTSTSLLSPDTLYTASLTTGIEDLAGNPLENAVTWSFTTGAGGGSGIDQSPPPPPF